MRRSCPSAVTPMLAVLVAGWVFPSALAADNGSQESAPPLSAPKQTEAGPIATITLSSVDAMLQDARYILGLADNRELLQVIEGLDAVFRAGGQGLAGVDPNEPISIMVFLDEETMQPQTVGVIPVISFEALQQTLRRSYPRDQLQINEIGDELYEFVVQDRTFYARNLGDQVYLSDIEALVARDLPDPDETLADYDIAATVYLQAIPEQARTQFLDELRSPSNDAEADGEAEAAGAAQDAEEDADGEGQEDTDGAPTADDPVAQAARDVFVSFVEMVLTDGDRLIVGLRISEEDHNAVVDLRLTAQPGTPLAETLAELENIESQFAGLVDPQSAFSAVLTLPLDPRIQEALLGAIDQAEQEALAELEGGELPEDQRAQVEELGRSAFQLIRGTVEQGTLDGVLLVQGEGAGEMTILGAARVADAAALSDELFEAALADSPNVESYELNVDEYEGVRIHEIELREVGEETGRLVGDNRTVYVGLGETSLWYAIGPAALDVLEAGIDVLGQAPQEDVAPVQLRVHLTPWLDFVQNAPPGRIELFREAFEQGDAFIRLSLEPAPDGARVRLELGEGALRGVSTSVPFAMQRMGAASELPPAEGSRPRPR